MTRPRTQTVEYFPHYCDHKSTMFILEDRYGNNGYAFWFKMLEIMGKENGHYIDCRDESKWAFLQAKTKVSPEICQEILDLLSKIGAIDPEFWKIRVIWSQNFVTGLAPVYRNRRVALPPPPSNLHVVIPPVEDNHGSCPSLDSVNHGIYPQSKVKYSKVEKTFLSDSEEIRLSELLFFLINERDPNAKKPNFQKWAAYIDRLIRIDKREVQDIENVITWCQNDSFWQNNILSTLKLRDKFTQLVLKMNGKGGQPKDNLDAYVMR